MVYEEEIMDAVDDIIALADDMKAMTSPSFLASIDEYKALRDKE